MAKRDQVIKAMQIFEQTINLEAEKYRITLIKRPEKFAKVLGKQRDGEIFFTAQDIQQKIEELTKYNISGFDIYITPFSPNFHYLVVDDVTTENLEKIEFEFGKANVVQSSSENNFQCIYKIDKKIANCTKFMNDVVHLLNLRYGDPKFTGIEHAFRLAGFANKKLNKNDFYTQIIRHSTEIVNIKS